jgi:hypothetical protein
MSRIGNIAETQVFRMKRITSLLVGVATLAGVVAITAPASDEKGTPIFVTKIPP